VFCRSHPGVTNPVADKGETIASRTTGVFYHLDEVLNTGGYGVVYRAHTGDDKPCDVKVFHSKDRDFEWVSEHWSDETEMLVNLKHPYIVDILDSFLFDKELYIVLELAECSLGDFVARGLRFPVDYVLLTAYRLLHALDHIHRHHHLIHRDLTPQNVLYFKDGMAKLSDFGISKEVPTAEDIARTYIFNRPFVVPELINMGYSSVQSDLYQLGLVLYSMLAGRYTIPPDLSWEKVKKLVKKGEPARLAYALPKYGVPLSLAFVMVGLLQVDANHRYQHARQVITDVVRIAKDMHIPLDPPHDEFFVSPDPELMPWDHQLFLPPKNP